MIWTGKYGLTFLRRRDTIKHTEDPGRILARKAGGEGPEDLCVEKGEIFMKEKVQKFGRFLSGMVMPNIGAFIAWGLIAALFIPDGWLGW